MATSTKARRALLDRRARLRGNPLARPPDEAAALDRYLHSWRGLGDVVGMTAQGCNMELWRSGDRWRTSFYAAGLAHSVVYGTAEEATPWHSVRKAAWQAINDLRMAG